MEKLNAQNPSEDRDKALIVTAKRLNALRPSRMTSIMREVATLKPRAEGGRANDSRLEPRHTRGR